ncbi:hypothetical protein U27_03029 [Candidatus Vecturithrix granuli]|uniref:Uncharacterized protein n=1 Tax=Vecturithrix granuli TaxID=1499967 RepID=A0A081BUR2_VECG1|nr:hypothetical protein U27_03029 [Candidatus Vecturithrix granuli]
MNVSCQVFFENFFRMEENNYDSGIYQAILKQNTINYPFTIWKVGNF